MNKKCIPEISLAIFCDILEIAHMFPCQHFLATNIRSCTFGGKVISASSHRVWASMGAQTTTEKEAGTLAMLSESEPWSKQSKATYGYGHFPP